MPARPSPHAHHQRSGDGQHHRRHADADAQRRRHRDLQRRLGHHRADLQLHGWAGQNTAALAATAVNLNGGTIKDGAGNAASLSLTGITQTGPQIDTTSPTVSSVTATAGDYNAGKVLTLTLNMSEAVTVTGTPTLTLNDGGTASYVSGSGTSALTVQLTVALGQNTAALQVTAVTGTITDLAGNALSTSSLPRDFCRRHRHHDADHQLDYRVTVERRPRCRQDRTLTLNLSEAVTVNTTGGTPTVTLNDGGTATYTGGSGTSALTFSYTVAAGQNTAGAGCHGGQSQRRDGHRRLRQCRQPVARRPDPDRPADRHHGADDHRVGGEPLSGDLGVGKTITYTLNMSEVVTVNTTGGSPTLSLNDGGTATYVSGSGTNALTFSYTVLAGQNVADLMLTAVNLNGATVQDGAGNAANLSLSGLSQGSPQIDTTTPTVSSVDDERRRSTMPARR